MEKESREARPGRDQQVVCGAGGRPLTTTAGGRCAALGCGGCATLQAGDSCGLVTGGPRGACEKMLDLQSLDAGYDQTWCQGCVSGHDLYPSVCPPTCPPSTT